MRRIAPSLMKQRILGQKCLRKITKAGCFLFKGGSNLHSLSSVSDSRGSSRSLFRVEARVDGLDEIFLRPEELIRWSFAAGILLLAYLVEDGESSTDAVELIAECLAHFLCHGITKMGDL